MRLGLLVQNKGDLRLIWRRVMERLPHGLGRLGSDRGLRVGL